MNDIIPTFAIPVAYFALFAAAIGAIVFPVIFMLQDFKKAKSALIGFGALVLVFFLAFVLSRAEGQLRFVEASLYTFYALLLTSVLAILYSTVSRYIK
jgi:hypothetical protein